MSKQILHYPCGKKVEREPISRHGLKLNNRRPKTIELWGASPEEVENFKRAVDPYEGEVILHV